jgi:outer membrane protein assembly factor BamB
MRWARTVLILGSVVAVAGCWTVPGAGPQRSGHNPFEPLLTATNVATLQPDWTWQADWTTYRAVQDPIVTPAGVHVSVGHKLVTVDRDTGAERWRAVLYDVGQQPVPVSVSKPAADRGELLVSVQWYRNLVPGSGTRRYDATTGAYLGDVARSVIEVPVPRDGRVVGTDGDVVGSGVGTVGYFVTDRADPSKSWSALLDAYGISGPQSISGPAVGASRFHFAYGATVYAYPFDRPAGCAPVASGGPDFCPPLWSRTFPTKVTPAVLSGDESLLVVADAGHVDAMDPATGALLWTGTLPTTDAPQARVAVDDGHVFVVSGTAVHAFSRAACGAAGTCTPEWTGDTAGAVTLQPAVAGGVVYTATTTGQLRAFRAAGCGGASCTALWSRDLGVAVTGAPAVAGGRLYVGTDDGRLIAFRPSNDGIVDGPMSGAGSTTLDTVGGKPILRATSTGTFGPTSIGSGTYTLGYADAGTSHGLSLGLVTGDGTLQASAGPLISGVDGVDLTVTGGTGRFAGSSGTLRIESYTKVVTSCLPTTPPVLCHWDETGTLKGTVRTP